MRNIGLKLWSINTDHYYQEAMRLYEAGNFNFIELYIIPGTYHTLEKWKRLSQDLGIPFTIHAPHFNHQVNLADKSKKAYNKKIFTHIFKCADALKAERIIFHPGVLGTIEETISQLKEIKEDRMIVENKPPFQVPSLRLCRGANIEEIKQIISEVSIKVCLDIGHAMCTANFLHKNPYEYLKAFQKLDPVYYHIMDNFETSEEDRHLNLGDGNYNLNYILNGIINCSLPLLLETEKRNAVHLNDYVKDANKLKNLIKDDHEKRGINHWR